MPIAPLLATLCAGLFAGAALYINLVEHPARMSLGTELAVREFGPSYHRATVMQASLAMLGLVTALLAWVLEEEPVWIAGGLMLGAVVPFTLLVILPTNRRLLDASLDARSTEARGLLDRWAALHGVRTGLSLSALVLFLIGLVGR